MIRRRDVIFVKITENVFQLEATRRSHGFLVRMNEFYLIDTGMPGLAEQILSELKSLGVFPHDIRAIFLTHHDVDHIGNAEYLRQATGAELWAPKEDVPYIVGEKRRPGVKRLIETVVRPLRPTVTGTYGSDWPYPDIHVLHAPGHTPGHTVFQIKNIIFTGDLFKTQNGRFRLFPKYMNWDPVEAKNSLSHLNTLSFDWLCPSHGNPVHNGPAIKDFLKGLNSSGG